MDKARRSTDILLSPLFCYSSISGLELPQVPGRRGVRYEKNQKMWLIRSVFREGDVFFFCVEANEEGFSVVCQDLPWNSCGVGEVPPLDNRKWEGWVEALGPDT